MQNGAQTGNWHAINRGLKKATVNGEIFKLWLDYGYTPTATAYEYAVLPNLTPQQTDLYASELPFVTLANSTEAQAIRHDIFNYRSEEHTSDLTSLMRISN